MLLFQVTITQLTCNILHVLLVVNRYKLLSVSLKSFIRVRSYDVGEQLLLLAESSLSVVWLPRGLLLRVP